MNESRRDDLNAPAWRDLTSVSRCLRQLFALVIAAFVIFAPAVAESASPDTPQRSKDRPAARRMLVDPSSSSVALGKADLVVGPLTHGEAAYRGDYQLKVTPYF